MRRPLLLPLLLALLAVLPALPAAEVDDLHRGMVEALRAEDYATAIARGEELIALAPDDAGVRYNLACALALDGQADAAMAALTAAVARGFHHAEHLAADPDLASLHERQDFADLQQRVAQAAERKLHDPGKRIPGLEQIERQPDGGLRYRLLMPPEPATPPRLLVWLHPSGGSGNRLIEALAPAICGAGFAILIPTQKRWVGWTSREAEQLFTATIPDAHAAAELDPAAPVCLGYSAGGQQALASWAADATRVSGLVLVAAYPVELVDGAVAPMPLPAARPEQPICPWLVFTGSADGGTAFWQRRGEELTTAGIALRHHVVPDKGHTWLITGKQVDRLIAWLAEQQADPAGPAVPP